MKASLKSQKRNRTTYIDTSLNSRTMTVFEFIPSFFAWSFSLRFLEFAVFQGSFCIASNLYILYGHLRLLRLATCNSSSTSELTNWDPSAPSRSVASRNCASCLWTGGGLWRRSEIWWTFDGHFACGFRVFRYSLLKEKSERKVIKWLFWWFFLWLGPVFLSGELYYKELPFSNCGKILQTWLNLSSANKNVIYSLVPCWNTGNSQQWGLKGFPSWKCIDYAPTVTGFTHAPIYSISNL